ncbi:PepSY domain-containing protein [Streptomyces brevispora]|uniref:PepSY domain-containing protein n=1 Tax=Streptomyces brevispora TaxID=887462 RepID=A0A561TUG7_9ACTN|nr:PepSY domain-containing protein [Streptomyces brevispora]TWF90734.1 peptidase YpeB-like protein [Streptomyces brevispora]WSC11717.1 PepSY domain-containing protein [Streptomyces brevispora]
MTCDPRPKNTGLLRAYRLRAAGAACVVMTAALLTGCGQDSGSTSTGTETSEAARAVPEGTASTSPSPSTSLTKDQEKRKALLASTKIPFDKAITTAEGAVAGSKLIEINLKGPGKSDDDTDASASASPARSGTSASPSAASASPTGSPTSTGPEWAAEVIAKDGTEHKVRIDALTGKVLQTVEEQGQDAQEKTRMVDRLAKATQTPQQAAKAATDKTKGTVTSIDLDENDKNVLVWSVDVVAKDGKKTMVDVDAANGSVISEHVDND